MTNRAMQSVAAHPGALAQLAAYLKSEALPVPRQLARYARNAAIPENTVDAVSPSLIIRALENCALRTGRPDFGVLFGEWANPRSYGPLSLLAEQCPTLGYAIEVRQRYMHVSNGAFFMELRRFGEDSHILHDVLPSFRAHASQFLAGVMVFTVKLARRVLGAAWVPQQALFGYAKPPDTKAHERFFRCPLVFGAEHFTLVCETADIDVKLPSHDPEIQLFMEQHLDLLAAAQPASIEAKVEHLIAANLEAGFANVENIAGILAMSARSLQRHLTECGTSFAAILDHVRRQTVLTFFRETPRQPVIALAHLLGYSDASTVSRFIAQHFGMDSRSLRREVRADAVK